MIATIRLLKRALPLILGSLFSYLIIFTDQIMTRGVGEDALSMIYLANQAGQIVIYLVTAIEIAITITSARCVKRSKDGDGDKRIMPDGKERRTALSGDDSVTPRAIPVSGAILCLILVGLTTIICIFAPNVVLSLFSGGGEIFDTGATYLRLIALSHIPYALSRALVGAARGDGQNTPSLIAPVVAFLANIISNACLIPHFGALGAGAATLVSRVIELFAVLFMTRSIVISEDASLTPPSPDVIEALFKVALPLLISQAIWGVNVFYFTRVVASTGNAAREALGVAGSLYNLFFAIAGGLSQAIGVRTTRLSEGIEKSKVKAYMYRAHIDSSLLLLGICGVLLGATMYLSRAPFISIFNLDRDAALLADKFIFYYAATIPLVTLSTSLLHGVVKARGDLTLSSLIDLGTLLIYLIPVGLLKGLLSPTLLFLLLRLEYLLKALITIPVSQRRIDKRQEAC